MLVFVSAIGTRHYIDCPNSTTLKLLNVRHYKYDDYFGRRLLFFIMGFSKAGSVFVLQ
jgi:hypothetical protein